LNRRSSSGGGSGSGSGSGSGRGSSRGSSIIITITKVTLTSDTTVI